MRQLGAFVVAVVVVSFRKVLLALFQLSKEMMKSYNYNISFSLNSSGLYLFSVGRGGGGARETVNFLELS